MSRDIPTTSQCAYVRAHRQDNCKICQAQRRARRQNQDGGFV